MKYICPLLLIPMFILGNSYIRVNQVGFLPDDNKQAIVGSDENIQGQLYLLKNVQTNSIVKSGHLGVSVSGIGPDTPFRYNYLIDFSFLNENGVYIIELEDQTKSPPFVISPTAFQGIIDNLLYFLRVARCGDNQPELHQACHLYDATNVPYDLTGGWHDAGDFLKFTKQEAYTTYLLLLSYELNKETGNRSFSDKNKNGLVDILDEAKIGLDYLVKLFPDPDHFVVQVGDMEADHSQGYRLPENDKLAEKNRPAFFDFDRNPLSKIAYALALGNKIFKDIPGYQQKAQKYLIVAKQAYEKAKSVGSNHLDKLCLAATELYLTTGEQKYWQEATKFNNQISWSDWGHYSDNTNLANARLAPYLESAKNKLRQAVEKFLVSSRQNLYGYDVPYSWGSLYNALSSANMSLFYSQVSNDFTLNELAIRIRDYTLGKNPWGVCFISGVGTTYPKNIHNGTVHSLKEAGVLNENTIPGAIAEGPFDRSNWEANYGSFVPREEDIYYQFHTSACVYHDHINDYVTNEPCIYGVAEAILHFSFYQKYLNGGDVIAPAKPQNVRVSAN